MKRRIINRIISILLVAVPVIFLWGCGYSGDKGEEKLSIVTTLFPQYDFSKQIAKGNAEVTLLLTPGAESHAYEPTPKDILKIQQADIFIYIGGTSEVWVDSVLESANNKDMKVLRLMDYITPIEAHHDSDEDSHDHEDYDEHIFTSLKNSQVLLDEICEAICEKDERNAKQYRENSEAYKSEIVKLDEKFEEMIEGAQRKTVVFGDRFPFVYFAEDYGLECYAAFSGCSSETEASSAHISELIDIVRSENIPEIFYIEFSSQTIADKIAAATGAKTALLHSCHNISKEDLENGIKYTDLMEQNYQNLSEALN